MRRSGQLQISFHAVFALVGGFLFLLFFFILIKNVVLNEETRDTRQLSYAVEATIKTAATNPDEFRIVDLPDATFRFICNLDEGESYLRIDDDSYESIDLLDYIPLFAPRAVKGDRLFTLTRTWRAPFPVGSFVFLSNNHTRYVLVGGMGDSEMLHELIEQEQLGGFDFLVTTSNALGSLEDEGHDHYRFIFFEGGPDALPSTFRTPENSALFVHVTGTERGTLTFYDSLQAGTQASDVEPFYGNELVVAAIFSDDLETFQCNMRKATEHLNTTINILLNRIDLLTDGDVTLECAPLLSQGKGFLDAYQIAPRAAFLQTSPLIGNLERINNQLYANNCPTLY